MKFMEFLRKNWFTLSGILILCGIFFGLGWWANERTGDGNAELVSAAYRSIADDSIFSTRSRKEVAFAGIRGMLSQIDDPYAELIEPEAAQNFQNTFQGKTGVVGLYTTNQDGQVVIAIVFPNGAAEEAGIQVGDRLLAIDGKTLDQDAKSSETGLLLRGVPGSRVGLKIEHAGEIQEVTLVRKEQQFVFAQMLPDRVGYIALVAYNQAASRQMKEALEELLAQNPAGVIWDLRNNEGGDMQAAQEILSYFIRDGLLFTAELTNARTVAFRAKGAPLAGDIPLVALIDHTTYSAAETSAAAIAERGRGKTIGSVTYGKGVIQATIPLPENAMLQMTVAKWISPNGEWYHGRGVPPQVEVVDDPATEEDELIEQAVELLK